MTGNPFRTYEVTTVKTKTIATITEESIGQIAAIVGGTVDYSGDTPVLIEPGETMRWKVGFDVGLLGGSLINENGALTGKAVTHVREVIE